ncbi:DUF881 domain-containing protein [Aneurinibacillus thermoaerophilus]|uniref:DUF881 domain-containing protein n=1 Tax=Aneurinibacillus thermoaerophilus TaxID=143495 RepID=UPI002E225CD4|nr:DUF881 domain-containing protein [Aneurinibacillus thermoaerophilus]MED0764642.1 DUF881 domain-containing protein [Aneurinibacillus thermoaerophilus]
MKNNRQVPFIITVISIIIGFMLALQFRSNQMIFATERQDLFQLRQNVQKEMERHQKLLNDISKYEKLLREYETSMNEGGGLSVIQEEYARIKRENGFSDVTGPGVIITIEDNPVAPGMNKLQSPVIDQDLTDLTSLLFANGAKAIAINGNRLIVSSSIRTVGEGIQVDTKPIEMPYIIKAIGEPQSLEAALRLPGSDRESMEAWFQFLNKKFIIQKSESVTVPAYQGTVRVKYMKPMEQKGAS